MKLSYIVLAMVLTTALYLAIRPTYAPVTVYESEDVPVTWTYDWQGGHGYDRFIIMNEEGPYNQF